MPRQRTPKRVKSLLRASAAQEYNRPSSGLPGILKLAPTSAEVSTQLARYTLRAHRPHGRRPLPDVSYSAEVSGETRLSCGASSAKSPRMRADRSDKAKRAAKLHAAGIENQVIAERLGLSMTSVREYLKQAKRGGAVTES